METKPRILYLLKILQERTDEEHQLSTNQLIEILNDEYGISTYRTTISKDVTALQQFGIDVVSVRSTQTRYFIGDRDFELAELKILIDAVESSKLITHKKSKDAIRQLLPDTGPRKCYVVNIGDSRTYHMSPGSDGRWDAASLTQITRDHSRRQEAIDSGEMTDRKSVV